MTEPKTATSPEAAPGLNVPVHPADVLMNLIVAILAPMFLTASGGDILFARMAALQTVNAYRARTEADLLAVAHIVAFGLAALGSLSLSMADNLSLSMTLRLRGNAVALNRAAEQNRRALKESRPDNATSANDQPAPELDEDFDEAAVVASVAAAQKRAAETQARMRNAEPAVDQPPIPAPAPIAAPPAAAPTAAAPMTAERQRQARWAAAMTDVAAEYTADIPNLPPMERKAATIRAAALSSCANDLLSGNAPPRLKPGALGAILRPNAT
ncbi:MAG: hypothetical protein P4L90_18765 [Rhodopila sp.]|nr:hypothetical protein [Rhodopila sp.]